MLASWVHGEISWYCATMRIQRWNQVDGLSLPKTPSYSRWKDDRTVSQLGWSIGTAVNNLGQRNRSTNQPVSLSGGFSLIGSSM